VLEKGSIIVSNRLSKFTRYGVTPEAYLTRARDCLRLGTTPSLFYAALELRCCVEARQAEYIEHLVPYKNKKIRPYKIGENREKIAKISGGNLIARLVFTFDDGQVFEGFHTPVPASLAKYCERTLDGLRHAQPQFRNENDPWWAETRDKLITNYRLAWIACAGNLLVPPLWSGSGKDVHPLVVEVTDDNRPWVEKMANAIGEHFKVDVDYLEAPPAHWICDL
jgi:hypothetical protein